MLKFYIDVINYLAIFAFLLGIITALLIKYKNLYLNIVVGLISLVGAFHRPHPRADGRAHAADGGARHGRGFQPGRPHRRAGARALAGV